MGYVQQQDIHLPTQTVREALQTTAELRQPESTPKEEKHAYVERVILMLELEELAEALIGVPGAGLTLEQRKRVSIGVELAARPEVLFLDEPTSGLDGLSALNIVRLLRRLVDSGQTVLCTIHQPADEVIETFDHLILLIRGGRLAYDGPLGPSCSTAIQYFQEQCRLVCAANQNPAEFFLDVVGAGSRSNNTTDWADRWLNSVQKANREKELDVMLSESQERGSLVAASSHKKFATSIWTQISIIMRRTWVFNWRDPDYLTAKLLMNLGNGLFNGLTYLNAPNTAAGAYNRALSAFVAVLVGPPLGLQAQARFMPLINIFLLRDRDAMSYHWLAAVIPAIVVEIPNALLTSLVYWLVWYFPVGYFTEASRAGYSLLLYELFAVFEHSLAQLIASAMPNLEAAFLANGFFFMFINTLAGTLSPESVTPSGWKWYYQLNPLYYYGEGAGTIVLEGLEIECSPSETYSFTPPLGSSCVEYAGEWLRTASGYLLDPNSATECQYCRYKDGQSYVS
jgi:ABC-type multidrug transport system ATPase subunit/ABC-type multidrug transport system permease subunit